MKEQMTEKKKLEDVTEVQMKYQKEIEAIVRGMSSPKVMHDRLLDYHENDIAAALEDMNPTERQRLYRILNAEEISEVLSYIDEEEIPSYLEEMDMKKKAAVVSEMDADEIADLLRQMDKKERETLTELLDEEVRHKIDLIDSFDEEQIGNRMSTNYVEIPSNVTVKQAMRELIRQAADNDNISTLYIVDENRIFCGAISLNDLIIAREDTNLEDLIVVSYPFVYATEEIADCIEWIKDYSEDSIPVLDEENRIIGVITSQDIVEVVDDEMGEDYAMLAGLTAEEDLEEPLKDSIKKRMPWLIVLLGLGLVVSSVVGMFEHVGRKNYGIFMKTTKRLLKPSGLFLLHTIGNIKKKTGTDPWINKYIFPNGMLPSPVCVAKAITGLYVMEDWHNFGADYDKTLMAWHQRFEEGYVEGAFQCSERVRRMYRYYLLSCAGAFRARDIQLWQIVLSPEGVEGGYCCQR